MGSKKKGKKAPERFHFFPQEGASHEGEVGTMTLAGDMRDLAQEIVNSFDARVAWVAELKQETAAMMKGIQQELRRKAADLKRFLATSESARLRDFRAMHEGIQAGQEARSRQLGEMMAGFRRENQAAAAHWRGMATTMAERRASVTQ